MDVISLWMAALSTSFTTAARQPRTNVSTAVGIDSDSNKNKDNACSDDALPDDDAMTTTPVAKPTRSISPCIHSYPTISPYVDSNSSSTNGSGDGCAAAAPALDDTSHTSSV
jgi:hypothetical protein